MPTAPPSMASAARAESGGPEPAEPAGPAAPAETAVPAGAGAVPEGAETRRDPSEEDEPDPQMPHHTDAEEYRLAPPRGRGDRPRPPIPTAPPQPPPPTGRPITGPRPAPLSDVPPPPSGAPAIGPVARASGQGADGGGDGPEPKEPVEPVTAAGPLRPLGTSDPLATGNPLGTGNPLATGRTLGIPGPREPEGPGAPGAPGVPGASGRPGAPGTTGATGTVGSAAEHDAERSAPPTARPWSVLDPARGRPARRTVAAAACLVLGAGLLGGSAAGVWLSDDPGEAAAAQGDFDRTRGLWHNVPVDELFPPVLKGEGAGPGGADRRWTRVAVAPDSDCANAFDPLLAKALSPAGCSRLVRATYADETTTSVTTVGLVFTRADEATMGSLRKRFALENLTDRTDLMPRPYAARGTVAADFGDAQRASWTVRVLDDAPVVVYAVTGFADGRVVSDPQAASAATGKGENSAAAQAGLGHDAQGIADRVERGLRKASKAAGTEDE
ncbi:hypothetical protein [Streptomyces daliensis]